MFWQRKNARLTARLETLVESSERVRKSRRRKPSRVIIDQTYVQNPPGQMPDADTYDPAEYQEEPGAAEARGDGDWGPADAVAGAAGYEHAGDPDAAADHESEEAAILHEAIEQLDQAEQREAAALREIEELRAEIEQEKAARLSLEGRVQMAENAPAVDADAAERAAEREAVARAEIAELRTALALAEDERQSAQAVSQATEVARQAAEARARAAEAATSSKAPDISLEEEVAVIRAEADARIAVARRDASAQRELLEELRKELFAAQSAQEDAEHQLQKAEAEIVASASELDTQRKASVQLEASLGEAHGALKAAEEQVSAGSAERDELRGAASRLEASLQEERGALTAAEERAAKAEGDVAGHLARIGELQALLATEAEAADEARKLADAAKRSASEAAAREAALSSELSSLATRAARLEADLAKAENAAEKAVKQRDKALATAAEAENARNAAPADADVAAAHARAEQAEAKEAEAQARVNALTGSVERLETELKDLQARLRLSEDNAKAEAERGSGFEDELAALRTAAIGQESLAGLRDQALADAAAARREADALRLQVSRLEAEIKDLREAPVAAQPGHANALSPVALLSPLLANPGVAVVEANNEDARAAVAMDDAAGAESESAGDDDISAVGSDPGFDEDQVPEAKEERILAAAGRLVSRLEAREAPNEHAASLRKQRPGSIATRPDVAAEPSSSAAPAADRIQSRISKVASPKQKASDKRRAKRVTSRKLAQLWHPGKNAGLSCTMLDRSSTGAKLEVVTDRFNDRMNDIAVGDRFTLVLNSAQERTTMPCEIMWVAGKRCGVEFCGQIRTEVIKAPKKAMPKAEEEKPTAARKIKSLFGSGAG